MTDLFASLRFVSGLLSHQLYIAADQGHLACSETLLIEGAADVNAACHSGWTPLMTAADEGHHEVIKLLIAHRADKSMRLGDGRTAAALFRGNSPLDQQVKLLLT